jgi:phosphomannomutase
MLRQGVVAGLLACGHDVIDLGIVSTPIIQNAIRRLDAGGGISIGASHNAAGWNALKFFGPDGIYLSTGESGELLDIYHLRKFAFSDWTAIGKLRREPNAIESYVAELAEHFDFETLKQFKLVVDCCNGTSSLILRVLQEQHGLNVILINERIDGVRFAHEPATNKDTIGLQLAPLVEPLGADAGFLFDLDSDRIAIATETGEPLSEEMVLPMLTDHLLSHKSSGNLVITNLSTTALVDEVAKKHDGRVIRVPVGRQAAIDALTSYRPEQIAIAGEGTGAVMMPDFRFVYDGIASMLAILTMMAERKQRLSQIVESYPKYSMLKAQFPLVSSQVPVLLTKLKQRYSDGEATVVDGLRVDWPDQWFHIRVSQTEPVIRIIAERLGGPPTKLFNDLTESVRRLG